MTFREYQAKFLRYQSFFYFRSDNYDPRVHAMMQELALPVIIEEILGKDQEYPVGLKLINFEERAEDLKRLTFEYSIFDNYDERKKKLDTFMEMAKRTIRIQPITIEGLEISFPFDYVRDGKGKIEPETLFTRWDRYLKVHKLKAKGLNNTQISQELGCFDECDVQNSLKAVRRDLNEAQKLIESTLSASFPYPADKTVKVQKP